MQLKITLTGKDISLPFASSHIYQGLIYKALSTDEKYSGEIHNVGSVSDGRAYKLFTFTDPKGRYVTDIGSKRIIYSDTISFEVRSMDAYLIQLLIVYFTKNETVSLGRNLVQVKNIKLEDKRIEDSKIVVKTASPISVHWTEDKKTIYFSPEDDNFSFAVVTNARRKWKSYTGTEDGFEFNIISTENRNYKKVATTVKNLCVTGYHGEFVLEGNPKVLDFLYQTGLGTKNSYGFGAFDVLDN